MAKEKGKKGLNMDHSRRFSLLRALTLIEIAVALICIVWSFQDDLGIFLVVLLMILAGTFAAGFIVALFGVIAKPRQRLMIISLSVHVIVAAIAFILGPVMGKWESYRRQEEYRHMREQHPPQ